MECCVIYCEKGGRYKYKLRDVVFMYCKKHTKIPDKIISNLKKGCYLSSRVGLE